MSMPCVFCLCIYSVGLGFLEVTFDPSKIVSDKLFPIDIFNTKTEPIVEITDYMPADRNEGQELSIAGKMSHAGIVSHTDKLNHIGKLSHPAMMSHTVCMSHTVRMSHNDMYM